MQIGNSALNELSATTSASAPATSSSKDLENRFLTLLITQIKNQDPLNPMENAEMTSQLAQLNMVGGIERLNGTIEGLAAGFRSQQALQATQLVGRSVLVPGTTIDHTGQGGRFGVELAAPVDTLSLRILDAAGSVVERLDLGPQPAGVHGLDWDGLDGNGQALPAGRYLIEAVATDAGRKAETTVLAAQRVSAVTTGAGGILIEMPGRAPVNLDQVRQIL